MFKPFFFLSHTSCKGGRCGKVRGGVGALRMERHRAGFTAVLFNSDREVEGWGGVLRSNQFLFVSMVYQIDVSSGTASHPHPHTPHFTNTKHSVLR